MKHLTLTKVCVQIYVVSICLLDVIGQFVVTLTSIRQDYVKKDHEVFEFSIF